MPTTSCMNAEKPTCSPADTPVFMLCCFLSAAGSSLSRR